jgi:hypothetical protein
MKCQKRRIVALDAKSTIRRLDFETYRILVFRGRFTLKSSVNSISVQIPCRCGRKGTRKSPRF